MNAGELLDQIFEEAKRKGMSRIAVVKAAGFHESAISRIYRTGDCRYSTLEILARAAGFRLAIVPNTYDAELLMKGELF